MPTSKNDTNSRNQQSQQQDEEKPKPMTRDEILNIAIELSEENKLLTNRNFELQEELTGIKRAVLSGDINAAIHAVHGRLQQANAARQQEIQQLNQIKANEIAERQQQEYNRYAKVVLEENPAWTANKNEKIQRIEKERDAMLATAHEFYLLDDAKASKYFQYSTTPEQSAAKDLVIEHTTTDQLGREHFSHYECDYCHEQNFHSMADFNRHCWYEGDSHHDANMRRIKDDATDKIAKVNTQFTNEVEQAIRSLKIREQKSMIAKQRAAQQKEMSELPYAKQH